MSALQEYLLVIGGFQGCLLFALLAFDSRLSTASRVLGVQCLLMASVFILPFLLRSESLPLLWIAGWVFYFPASSGALAYLYCRTALLDKTLSLRDAAFFIPFVSCYLLTADVFLLDPAEMAAWISGGAPNTWRLQASEYLMFAQAFIYACFTASMIWKYRKQANATLANFNPSIFRWFLVLQVFTIAIWVLNAFPALSSAPYTLIQTANALMVILVYLIAITQWRTPQLFTIPSLADEQASGASLPVNENRLTEVGELDQTMRASLFAVIEAELTNKKLYLDSSLTLSGLAEATGISRHQVSEVLNRHAGKNFYEYINGYRIAAVRKRLEENDSEKVLNIALDAGFSSKSTFNAIFKQFTGKTPTQYRQELAQREA